MKKYFLTGITIFLFSMVNGQVAITPLSTEKKIINNQPIAQLPISGDNDVNRDPRLLKQNGKVAGVLPASTAADMLLFDTTKLRRPIPGKPVQIN